METFRLVWRNLTRHWIRSLLTVGSLVVAMFLLCSLRSLVTTIEKASSSASSRRLVVQSAVSLFVSFPTSYQAKIAAVDGVERTCKWQWFGGYYKDPSNFFAQFAVDPEPLFDMYPEIVLVDGSREAFLSGRTACLIGEGLSRQFGWKIGDTIPLIGALFPHPDGPDVAWTFEVAAIYRPGAPNLDDRTMFFHWDYFEETEELVSSEPPEMGVMVVTTKPGADPTQVMAAIDAMFANGPQRTQTTTESAFQAQFASMLGNVPFFVSSIGGGVLIAILLACVNTMLMAGREQTHDVGILKALGFTNARVARLMAAQSLFLCGLGGALGVGLSLAAEPGIAHALGTYFPGFAIERETAAMAFGASLLVGLVAGLMPAWNAGRLAPVDALRTEE